MKKFVTSVLLVLSCLLQAQAIAPYPSVPHFSPVFTQGLIIDDNIVWESSGLYGESMLTKWDLLTGKIIKQKKLEDKYFAEGLTELNGHLFMITWREQTAFEFDKDSLELVNTFKFSGEGWGLTTDGKQLIMSNGSSTLQFVDPKTFKIIGKTRVHKGSSTISRLNELEYIDGLIWANVYQTDYIVVINPISGSVVKTFYLPDLLDDKTPKPGVLNGIAYDKKTKKTWVTGKLWPLLFEL